MRLAAVWSLAHDRVDRVLAQCGLHKAIGWLRRAGPLFGMGVPNEGLAIADDAVLYCFRGMLAREKPTRLAPWRTR